MTGLAAGFFEQKRTGRYAFSEMIEAFGMHDIQWEVEYLGTVHSIAFVDHLRGGEYEASS